MGSSGPLDNPFAVSIQAINNSGSLFMTLELGGLRGNLDRFGLDRKEPPGRDAIA
jgi:hypothetical protein